MSDKLAPDKRFKFVHNGQTIYEWDQNVEEVNMYVPLPPGVPSNRFECKIQKTHLLVTIKGNPPYLDHDLAGSVIVDESFWTIEDGVLHVTLQKCETGQPWPGAIRGHNIDPYSEDLERRRLLLERFQVENPGFDFSGAELTGACPNPAEFLGGMKHT